MARQTIAQLQEMVGALGFEWKCRSCQRTKRGLSFWPDDGDTIRDRLDTHQANAAWLAEQYATKKILCMHCRALYQSDVDADIRGKLIAEFFGSDEAAMIEELALLAGRGIHIMRLLRRISTGRVTRATFNVDDELWEGGLGIRSGTDLMKELVFNGYKEDDDAS